ncbi:MAG: hypothetical protein H0U22_14575 [Geodermatophilaceae bacterium]|nr:hypothetical protein [Geodermatophilaceae bacterium]
MNWIHSRSRRLYYSVDAGVVALRRCTRELVAGWVFRIRRSGDLDAQIPRHLGVSRRWHVIDASWRRQQMRDLVGGEVLGRALRGGAVHPQPRRRGAPHPDTACASLRSAKSSPAKKFPRTYCTIRSTRGLSFGERTRAGSVPKPRA